jgi:endonuclease/exonuclease/phosphatase family metal-dependent hydrolase
MRLLVRSWNIFHGRTWPETVTTDPEPAVRLICEGEPDVVCLQEVPVWALPYLEAWSGMAATSAVTMRAPGGRFARRLTETDPRRLRSALTGQANAILVSRQLRVESDDALVLNPRSVRRRKAKQERLSLDARLAWRRNRRVAQPARVTAEEGSVLVVNLHLTTHHDGRLAEHELVRAVTYVEGLAGPDEPIVLCGDLNLTPASSTVLRDIEAWGFSPPLKGVDQIAVRGLAFARGPEPWPEERRRVGGVLLSDHAPLEAEMIGA